MVPRRLCEGGHTRKVLSTRRSGEGEEEGISIRSVVNNHLHSPKRRKTTTMTTRTTTTKKKYVGRDFVECCGADVTHGSSSLDKGRLPESNRVDDNASGGGG